MIDSVSTAVVDSNTIALLHDTTMVVDTTTVGQLAHAAPYIVLGALLLFLPLTALTYYKFRRHRRESEVKRILDILEIEEEDREAYEERNTGRYLFWAVLYSSVISVIGLALLFLGHKIPSDEFPQLVINEVPFPKDGSTLVFGMAFLGAYLWGLQHVFRRYSLNDLNPGVYYTLSLRMILAAVIAMLVFNAFAALGGSSDLTNGIA